MISEQSLWIEQTQLTTEYLEWISLRAIRPHRILAYIDIAKRAAARCPDIFKNALSITIGAFSSNEVPLHRRELLSLVRNSPNLKALRIKSIPLQGDELATVLSTRCPALESLEIHCEDIKISLAAVCKMLDALRSIKLFSISATLENNRNPGSIKFMHGESWGPGISFEGGVSSKLFRAVVNRSPKADRIAVESCSSFFDEDLIFLVNKFPHLTHLILGKCPYLTDKSFQEVGKLPSLIDLVLANNDQLTDAGVQAIARGCSDMTEMFLSGSPQTTEASVEAFAEHSRKLQKLFVQIPERDRQGYDTALGRLKETNPGIDIEYEVRNESGHLAMMMAFMAMTGMGIMPPGVVVGGFDDGEVMPMPPLPFSFLGMDPAYSDEYDSEDDEDPDVYDSDDDEDSYSDGGYGFWHP
jgi:hypothetical protein